MNYFTSLFRSDVPNINNMDEVLAATSQVVNPEMNQYLLAEFTKSEVDVALKQMSPLKAHGPDGLPLIFFQHYWDKIGGDVVKVALTWLNSGTICPSFNHTYITLIPKVKCPQKVTEFRPIGFCNILYKLVSKVSATSLKKLLPNIISDGFYGYGCISSVSYSILVNGEPQGDIKPTRGLRQGDYLFPYLFLLVSEGLNGLIQQAVTVGDLRGFSLCHNGPQISHLFFADDTLLFCRAELREVQTIQNILQKYELASGQKINLGKTTLFFGKSVSLVSKNAIKNLLGVPKIKEYERYLGLSDMVGRNRKASLNYIKERI